MQRLTEDGGVTGAADGIEIVKTREGVRLFVAEPATSAVSVWTIEMRKREVTVKKVNVVTLAEFGTPTTVTIGAGRVVVANLNLFELQRDRERAQGLTIAVRPLREFL